MPQHVCRSIINNVLNVFRPKRWVLTMVADKAGLDTITENPFDAEKVGCWLLVTYFGYNIAEPR